MGMTAPILKLAACAACAGAWVALAAAGLAASGGFAAGAAVGVAAGCWHATRSEPPTTSAAERRNERRESQGVGVSDTVRSSSPRPAGTIRRPGLVVNCATCYGMGVRPRRRRNPEGILRPASPFFQLLVDERGLTDALFAFVTD